MDVTIPEREITDEDLAVACGEGHITFPCPSVPPIRC